MSDCCDLGLQVYHKSGELREEMFSIQHVDTHLVPEDGCITCTITGVCKYCLLNSSLQEHTGKSIHTLNLPITNTQKVRDHLSRKTSPIIAQITIINHNTKDSKLPVSYDFSSPASIRGP